MRALLYSLAAVGVAGVVLFALALTFVAATKETESKFFQHYDPVALVGASGLACYFDGSHADRAEALMGAESHGSGDRWRDIRHTKDFQPSFCGSVVKNAALMASIENNVLMNLQSAACTVSEDRLGAADGLSVKYRCGDRTTGSLTATIMADWAGPRSLLKVDISETYAVRR